MLEIPIKCKTSLMTNDPNEVHIAVNKIKNAKKKLDKIRGELKNSNWKII